MGYDGVCINEGLENKIEPLANVIIGPWLGLGLDELGAHGARDLLLHGLRPSPLATTPTMSVAAVIPNVKHKPFAHTVNINGVENRKQEVSRMMLMHMTGKEIAEKLGVSTATISRDQQAVREQWRQRAAETYEQLRTEEMSNGRAPWSRSLQKSPR